MIRYAGPEDATEIHRLIKALAEYEREPDAVTATPQQLEREMSSYPPSFECLLAETDYGAPVGFALFFQNFSTWQGKPGMYLEDLFVVPESRGEGTGKALLRKLAAICREREYGHLEFRVLSWNDPAIKFYESIGVEVLPDWRICRLSGEALNNL